VAPGEDSKVAAYVSETSARYQRVGLYKDYVPGKDAWKGKRNIDKVTKIHIYIELGESWVILGASRGSVG
jgi:hypothetical protein